MKFSFRWNSGLILCFIFTANVSPIRAEGPYQLNRCEIVPLTAHQVSFRIDGVEKVRWHYGSEYPRPFFYPLNGPSDQPLTRMGHPGAANHDHHRSVWFAHHDVNGEDFWSDQTGTRIRQKQWFHYSDGETESIMASLLGWYDASGNELMEQEVVAALIPLPDREHAFEVQITMRPPNDVETVELGKTNFGFLAVRVAKSLSVHFGGGQLTSSEGLQGEAAIFGNRARWMDYSGPIAVGVGPERKTAVEGITYFDHPSNPRFPTHWHVREDGWMGASFCMHERLTITREQPLKLRYLLHAHRGPYDGPTADSVQHNFASRPGFVVAKSSKPHHQFEVTRAEQ